MDTLTPTGSRPAPARKRRVSGSGTVLAVAVLGSFMAFVDATIVNIAVPSIAAQFSDSPLSSVSWVLNAYNIVFAAFLVGGGQLADLLGRRRVFSVALLLFTLGSTLCAAAPTLGVLVAARVVQAIGAAALVPSSLAIVLDAHESNRRMHAVALWAAVAALAAGIGPPLGGLLITASSWRLVFLVNVPIGIVAFVLTRRLVVESRAPGRRRMPDLLGALVLAVAIGALVLGVVKGQEWGWTSARVIVSFGAAVALGAYFVFRSSRQRVPVVDLALLRIRAFALSNGLTLVMAGGFYAYTLCNVLFLTTAWRYSILQAGLAMTPGPIVAIAVAEPGSRLVERLGHRRVLVPGALIWACGAILFARALGATPDFLGGWLPGMAILGVGAGLTFPTLSGAAVGSVPGPRFAIATSLNSVARQLGAALGVAVLIAIVSAPSARSVLEPFQHGWLFAAGCFLAGSIGCAALVLDTSVETEPHEQASSTQMAARRQPAEAGADEELQSLSELEAERAELAPQTTAEFLGNAPVFAGLSERLRERVASIARSVAVGRGEWLFREGDPGDGVYVVRLGQLEVLADELGARRINTLTRSAVIGELAVLNDSPRSASVRALRDSVLLKIERSEFESLLRSEPELALSLTRVLSAQLQSSRSVSVERRARPATIALAALGDGVELMAVANELSRAMCESASVAVLLAPERDAEDAEQAFARFAPLVERCELEHDHVIMVCAQTGEASAWNEFCLAHADRIVAVIDAARPPAEEIGRLNPRVAAAARGADLAALDVTPGSGTLAAWVARMEPESVYSIEPGARRAGVARMARRLGGRALGVVLAGGGARAFAHLGALDVLLDAGVRVDRVAGVSMGSFIAGQLACGRDSAAIDACCFEEWVRRNPINDYTVPRTSLIRGRKAEAMLERVFGELRVEELAVPFYCVSANLRGSRLVIERSGPMVEAVGASISLPLIAPPIVRDDGLLIDGSLLDNLPVEPMSAANEGPVLAIDIKGGEHHVAENRAPSSEPPQARTRRRRPPSLPETMARIALLSSASTDESARRYADMTIGVRVGGVGLLEFHQIDAARAAGKDAALAALEHAPSWLLDSGERSGASSRRTVIRL